MNAFVLLLTLLSQPAPAAPTDKTFRLALSDTQTFATSINAPRACIVGSGPNGTDKTGPIMLFQHQVKDGITLGAGDPFRATGTLIERVRIARQGTGGIALNIEATNTQERPGELVIRDVWGGPQSDLQSGVSVGGFDTVLRIWCNDEPELIKSGVAGIRRTRLDHIRASSCLGDSIVLHNVTHLVGTDIQVDRGSANRVPSMVVENSRHVFLYGLNVFGELSLRSCNNVRVDGFVKILRIDSDCRDVIVTAFVEQHDIKSPVKNRINVSGMGVVK